MNLKLMGALLVVAGCGGLGFYMALWHKREMRTLRDLISVLEYIECELQYRMTPLPELCRKAGGNCNGSVGVFFQNLEGELNSQISPNVRNCAENALAKTSDIPLKCREYLLLLGSTLGQFDMDGQLKGVASVRIQSERELEHMENGRDERIRSYQTLGLCAGAALAILLM